MRDFLECDNGVWIPRERIAKIIVGKMEDTVITDKGDRYVTFNFNPNYVEPLISVQRIVNGEWMPAVVLQSKLEAAFFVDPKNSAILVAGELYFIGENLAQVETAMQNQIAGIMAWEFEGNLDHEVCLNFYNNFKKD